MKAVSYNLGISKCTNDSTKRYDIPEGLTRTQKRNLKKNIREKEKKTTIANEAAKDKEYLKDPLQLERCNILESVANELRSYPMFSEMKASDVMVLYGEQQRLLTNLLTRLTNAQTTLCLKIEKPSNRRHTSAMLLERLKELENAAEQDHENIDEVKKQLQMTVSWENARKLQGSFEDLKARLEDRIALNRKLIDTLHQREKMQSILLRVINMKANLNELKENVITLDKLKTEPLEVLPIIASNTNLLLKLQRQFGVVLEPKFPGSRVRGFMVYGLLEDVNAFLTFFRSVPWSTPTQITMPQEVIPSIIGKGGHALRQLEEKYKCVIYIKVDGIIVLYGSKENTKKLQEYFETIKTTKRQDSFVKEEFPLENHYIGRALQTTFSDILRNIESTLNVSIRVILPQKLKKITSTGETNVTNLAFGGDCTNLNSNQDTTGVDAVQGFITIRGRTLQDIKQAKLEINTVIKEWIIANVSVPLQHLNNLFSFIGGNSRSIDRTESSELWDAAEKLKILVNVTEHVAFIKDPIDGIVLVGSKDKVNLLKPQIEELIQKASYVPLKLTLSPAVAAVCCSTDHLQELQEKYGVVIRKLRPSQTIPTSRITIVGPPEAAQKAFEEIEEWIQKRGCSFTIKTDNKKILSALQQIDTLRLLEKKKKCRIFFNNAESTITFVGTPEAIVYEESQFENLCKSFIQTKQSKINSFTDKSQMHGKTSQALDNVSPRKALATSKGFNHSCGNISEKLTTLPLSSKDTQTVSTATLPDFDDSFPSLMDSVETQPISKHGNRLRNMPKPALHDETPEEINGSGINPKMVDTSDI